MASGASYINATGRKLTSSAATQNSVYGTRAAERLTGTDKNDFVFSNDGADTMAGGAGDDVYTVYNRFARVTEVKGEGNDTVRASVSFTLPNDVENLILSLGNITGRGNSLDNIIVGSGTGPQTFDGAGGNDVLVAGGGKSTFVVAQGEGSDVIYGFKAVTDIIQLDGYQSLTSFEKVKAAMSQDGADTVINLGGGETLTLRDRAVGDFSADNFRLPLDRSQWKLTFSDEFTSFSGSATGRGTTWMTTYPYSGSAARTLYSNHEAEYYSDSSVGVNPFSIRDGMLDITAARATPGVETPAGSGLTWTSGLITSFRSFSQLYGYFEVRAQMPAGQGFWPAFWMLPADNSWPPELDVFEVLGHDPSILYSSTHSKVGGPNVTRTQASLVDDTSAGFHTYGVNWQSDTITWYIDGNAVAEMATPADMHKPMYMLLNVAVGGQGSWPGATNASTPDQGHMLVDYVRAYTATIGTPTVPQTSVPPQPARPTLTLAPLGSGGADAALTASGIAAAGARVILYDGETVVGSATAAAGTGAYSIALPLPASGRHNYTAKVHTNDGASSDASAALTVQVGTAAQIATMLDDLQTIASLAAIYVTDTPVLPVASVAEMNRLLSSDRTALAAIRGGYSFSVTTTEGATSTVASFDAAGQFLSSQATTRVLGQVATSTTTYRNGSQTVLAYVKDVLTSETHINSDGSRDISLLQIVGQSYTSERSTFDAAGTLTGRVRTDANGTIVHAFTFDAKTNTAVTREYDRVGVITLQDKRGAGGSSEVINYADGQPKTVTQIHADGTKDVYRYDIAGEDVRRDLPALLGTAGNNVIALNRAGFVDGAAGSDNINGSSAADVIQGGAGKDFLYGGQGDDTFLWGSSDVDSWGNHGTADAGTAYDKVFDFQGAGAPGGDVMIFTDFGEGSTFKMVSAQKVGNGSVTYDYLLTNAATGDYQHVLVTSMNGKVLTSDDFHFCSSAADQHYEYDAHGNLLFLDQTNADAGRTHTQKAFQSGVALTSTAGVADTFESAGGTSFVFGPGFAKDLITGFHAGNGPDHDTIVLSKSQIHDFGQLDIASAGSSDTLIRVSQSDTITIKGVLPTALTADNFQFVA